MKRHSSRAQRDHSTPRPPTTSAWLGEGRRLMELGPAVPLWLPMGSPGKHFSVFPWCPVLCQLPGPAWS